MALTIFVFIYLWSSVLGRIDPLEQFCANENDRLNWTDVDVEDWYWKDDYNEQVALGTKGVFPAGFRPYTLVEFNEPPVCMSVPNSGDKKVEILIETTVEDAHICIHDATDIGFANNDVGNVDTCAMGLLYSCFTAAEAEDDTATYEDFAFYVYCKESCEASDIGIWLRIRTSTQTWEAGKTGVADDLEMWCEMEKGTVMNGSDGNQHNYFSYPEDLVSDEPLVFPFRIIQVDGNTITGSDGNTNTVVYVVVGILICLFFMIGGICVAKNHEQLPESCAKFIPCAESNNFDEYE